ncbi:uncharacterized protein [Haliotis cracherodii]|uniref:uncharacterized protein n=1 Tax=Haliotis cracherodii TaxID=6455 RepID=UPI0039E92FB2
MENKPTCEEDFKILQEGILAERAARRKEDLERNPLHFDIPPLPEDKDYHLFISYCTDQPDEVEWVEQLVTAMEKHCGLTCCWPKRDFIPGHAIGAEIQRGILKSMKVVFILSPAAIESQWCEFERNLAFGVSVENRENQIIPVMLSECDVPGILKTLNYIDVPSGEDFVFRIRRCFDEDTRVMKYLVPEIEAKENRTGTLNGLIVRISGEKNMKSVCRGPAWSFRDLDLHQRLKLRQLGSKFAERAYYEAKNVINKSASMKYFSLRSRFWSLCGIGLVLWFLFITFIVAIVHTEVNPLFDATFMWFGLVPGLTITHMISWVVLYRWKVRKVVKWVRRYSLEHILETNIFVNFQLTNSPSIRIMYYNIKPCLDYICGIVYRKLEEETDNRVDKKEMARITGRRMMFSFIENNFDHIYESNTWTTIVNRHPTCFRNRCICEELEKNMLRNREK